MCPGEYPKVLAINLSWSIEIPLSPFSMRDHVDGPTPATSPSSDCVSPAVFRRLAMTAPNTAPVVVTALILATGSRPRWLNALKKTKIRQCALIIIWECAKYAISSVNVFYVCVFAMIEALTGCFRGGAAIFGWWGALQLRQGLNCRWLVIMLGWSGFVPVPLDCRNANAEFRCSLCLSHIFCLQALH